MKFITNLLKKRRKVKLLKKISILKAQSDQYLKLSELERENAERVKKLISIIAKKAEYDDHWAIELENYLFKWNKDYTNYMISSAEASTTAQNIEYEISVLEKELKEL